MTLRELREERGMTRKELAAAMNVTPVTIMRYENGTRGVMTDTAIQIAKILDVSISEVVWAIADSRRDNQIGDKPRR